LNSNSNEEEPEQGRREKNRERIFAANPAEEDSTPDRQFWIHSISPLAALARAQPRHYFVLLIDP
jgi:hypothetical protein